MKLAVPDRKAADAQAAQFASFAGWQAAQRTAAYQIKQQTKAKQGHIYEQMAHNLGFKSWNACIAYMKGKLP